MSKEDTQVKSITKRIRELAWSFLLGGDTRLAKCAACEVNYPGTPMVGISFGGFTAILCTSCANDWHRYCTKWEGLAEYKQLQIMSQLEPSAWPQYIEMEKQAGAVLQQWLTDPSH